jgi:hypothetical protein
VKETLITQYLFLVGNYLILSRTIILQKGKVWLWHMPYSVSDDVELKATTFEDRLSKAWENVEKHMASIIEQVQEVKTALEQLKIGIEQQQKDTPGKAMEGMPTGETVQLIAQRSANFVITPDM